MRHGGHTDEVAKIMMPAWYLRRSVGRQPMSEAVQALCFLAGVNFICYGDQPRTTANPAHGRDRALLEKPGMPRKVSPRYSDIGPAGTPASRETTASSTTTPARATGVV